MKVETHVETPEAAQVTALAQLPRDLAVLKMENDSIMAFAVAHPRDYGEVLADIKTQLSTFKAFAKEAVYCRPVGKDQDGHTKYARGLSIRAAEALAAAYKYNRARIEITPIDDEHARVEATFVDFATGRMWQDARVVSRTYTGRDGKQRKHNVDRFFNVVCGAEGSKRLRECITRSVPPGLRAELILCANEQVDSFLDDSTVGKLFAEFANIGVTQDMLEALIGKRWDSFDKEDRRTLLGVWNSIKDGESTVQEVFGANGDAELKRPQAKQTKPTGKKPADKKPDAATPPPESPVTDPTKPMTTAQIATAAMKLPPAEFRRLSEAYNLNLWNDDTLGKLDETTRARLAAEIHAIELGI